MKKQNLFKRIVALAVAVLVVATGVTVISVNAANVTKSISSWSGLKSELGNLASGDVATFNITSALTANEKLTIPAGTTVTLNCNISEHSSSPSSADIARAKAFTDNLFVVSDKATLKIQCCITGSAFSSGNWRGFFTTADDNTASKGSLEYCGKALILNCGTVELIGSKAILKHNYNPYSNYSTNSRYLESFHRSAGNTNVSSGWTDKKVRYSVTEAAKGDDTKGGAVYNKHGAFTMKADSTGVPSIYDCIADYGGAIYHEAIYGADDLRLEAGKISNCLARMYGGAVYAGLDKNVESAPANKQAEWDNFSFGKDVGNSEDMKVYQNRAPRGGGIYSNIRIDYRSGALYDNQATGRFSNATSSDKDAADATPIELLGRGGGIYISGHSDTAWGSPTLNIFGGSIRKNLADSGAGVYATGSAGTITMSGGEIKANAAGVLTQSSLAAYRQIVKKTVFENNKEVEKTVVLPVDKDNNGVIDYAESVMAGNFYDSVRYDAAEKSFKFFLLIDKYTAYLETESGKNGMIGCGLTHNDLRAALKKTESNGGLYVGEQTVGGVVYKIYKPIDLTYTLNGNSEITTYSFENEYLGIPANCFDADGYFDYGTTNSVSEDEQIYARLTKNSQQEWAYCSTNSRYPFDWEGPYAEDEVSVISKNDEADNLTGGELFVNAYYNSTIVPCFFGTKTAITNEKLKENYGGYVGRGGGVCTNTKMVIEGGTIGGTNTVATDLNDNSKLGTITELNGNVSYKDGGGIYVVGAELIIDGANASISGNLTDERGGGILIGENATLKFISGTVANNRTTLNYQPAKKNESYSSEGSGGGIYLSPNAKPSVIGSANSAPEVYGNESINYGGGISSLIKGTVVLDSSSSAGHKIVTPGLVIRNINLHHNKTGLAFRSVEDDRNYSSGGGLAVMGSCKMENGKIFGNYANTAGAGVYCSQDKASEGDKYFDRGAFEMTGGEIYNNGSWTYDLEIKYFNFIGFGYFPYIEEIKATTLSGGGLYTTTTGQPVILTGVSIRNNAAENGAGIYTHRWTKRFGYVNEGEKNSSGVTITDEYITKNLLVRRGNEAPFGLALVNCTINSNESNVNGAGVYCGGAVLIRNTDISSNTSKNKGGGLYVGKESVDVVTIDGGSTISANSASDGYGGGICNYGIVNITKANIYQNRAVRGAGIYNGNSSSPGGVIDNDKLQFNGGSTSKRLDGYSSAYFGKLNINAATFGDVKIYENTASGYGGGLYFTTQGENSTVKNADIYANTATEAGGGICSYRQANTTFTFPNASESAYITTESESNVSIDNTQIHNNTATHRGGGVYWGTSSDLSFVGASSVYENESTGEGAGVAVNKEALVSNANITKNKATGTLAGNGGGIYFDKGGSLENSVISNNTASCQGGGVYSYQGTTTIKGTTISGNTADTDGGAVYNKGDTKSLSNIVLVSSILSGNTAKNGGGIYNGGLIDNGVDTFASVTIKENVVISNNVASESGAGVYNAGTWTEDESLEAGTGVEISGNTAKNGGAFYNANGRADTYYAKISNNTAKESGGGVYNNKIFNSQFASYSGNRAVNGGALYNKDMAVSDSDTFNGNISTGNGGAVCNDGTATVTAASFTKNTGRTGGAVYNSNKLSLGVTAFTENGATENGGAIYNNGEIEFDGKSTYTSNTATINGGAVYNDKEGTITSPEMEFVTNSAPTYGGAVYNNNVLSVTTCSFTENSSRWGGALYNAADGKVGNFTSESAEFKSNTVTDYGAAINNCGVVNVTSLVFENNTADLRGGAIYNDAGGQIISETAQFKSNKALEFGGASYNGGTMEFKTSTFTDNRAAFGGAVYNNNGSTVTSENAEFSQNKATQKGGAIYNLSTLDFGSKSILVSSDVSFRENEATESGGAIYNGSSVVVNLKGINFVKNKSVSANKGLGGAIHNEGKLEIIDSVFEENTGTSGGAILTNSTSVLTTSGVTYINNKANTLGGAIYNEGGTLTSTNDEYSGNSANSSGGGLYCERNSNMTLNNASIHDNKANYGAGVRIVKCAKFEVNDGDIYSNNAAADGGAFYTASGAQLVSINNTKIRDNTSVSKGGAIFNAGGNLKFVGGEMANNVAGSTGGFLHNANTGTLTFDNTKIHNNSGTFGGAIRLNGCDKFVMNDSDVYSNTTTGDGGALYIAENSNGVEINGGNIYDNTGVAGAGIYSVSSFDVNNTNFYENNASFRGGAIYVTSSAVLNSNGANYSKNTSEDGGAICVYKAVMSSANNVFDENSVTDVGGAIYNDGVITFTEKNVFTNNFSVMGGGAINSLAESTITASELEFKNNSSLRGGAVVLAGSLTITDGASFIGNRAESDTTPSDVLGGAIYITATGSLTTNNAVYDGNSSANLGGAIVCYGGTMNSTNDEFKGNTINGNGGSALYANTTSKIVLNNVSVHDNAGKYGAVRLNGCTQFTMNEGKVYSNESKYLTAIYNGGAFYIDQSSKNVQINDSEIYSNTGAVGAGIWNASSNGVTFTNTVIHSNTGKGGTGGSGIYNTGEIDLVGSVVRDNVHSTAAGGIFTLGTVNIKNNGNTPTKIYGNSGLGKTSKGGGIFVGEKSGVGGTVNMEDGEIYGNKSTSKIANGIYISPNGVFSMTGGRIYENAYDSNNTQGVYVAGATEDSLGRFEMSGDAIVEDTDTVYLEEFAYVSVPTEFTGDKDVRANITGANMVLGRVVAKNTAGETPSGTKVLYHNAESPVNTDQYFTVEGKELRAGDQGASAYAESGVANEDVYITEMYNVNFDMNPKDVVLPSITHTISGIGSWDFPTLTDGYVSEGVYKKYWYEPLNDIDVGTAKCNKLVFLGWNTSEDGSGTEIAENELVSVDGNVNKDVTYYGIWSPDVIDINYIGNGATEGNDYTETNVDSSDELYELDDGVVSKDEEEISGRKEGEEVFERKEDVVEEVLDEEGNPVIDEETGEVVTEIVGTNLYSFEGWCFATVPSNRNSIMDFSEEISMEDVKEHLKTSSSSTFSLLRSNNLETSDGENQNSYADIYAVWDQYPVIYAKDRYFSVEQAKAGYITEEVLMDIDKVFACDGYDKNNELMVQVDEDGNPVRDENNAKVPLWTGVNTNFYDVDGKGKPVLDEEESFTMIDYDAGEFKNLKAGETRTVTFCAVDRVGNTTYKTITVHITGDGEPKHSILTRFISEKYFKDKDGNFVPEEYGGFNEKSNWVTNPDYVNLLTEVFKNKKNEETGKWNTVKETWFWTKAEVDEAKQFVEDEGLGNIKQERALTKFRERFGPNK